MSGSNQNVTVTGPNNNTVNLALGATTNFNGGLSVTNSGGTPVITDLGNQPSIVVNGARVSGSLVGPVITNPAGTPLLVNGFTLSARATTFLDASAALVTTGAVQMQVAQAIINAQLGGSQNAGVNVPGGSTSISGGPTIPAYDLLLDNPGTTYTTAGTPASVIVAGDGVPVTVINNAPSSALIAATGAANNTLEGLAGANQFVTANGGQDAVLLDGAANALTTNGADAVLVGGPSQVVAAPTGLDLVAMTAGTTLTFVNESAGSAADSITGAAGGTVVIAGPGNAVINAGGGAESFIVDTSAGNTTLNGAAGGADTFLFVKDANAGSASDSVVNFASTDTLDLHGYTGFSVQAGGSGAVLALSDGSQVSFAGASVASIQQAIKVV